MFVSAHCIRLHSDCCGQLVSCITQLILLCWTTGSLRTFSMQSLVTRTDWGKREEKKFDVNMKRFGAPDNGLRPITYLLTRRSRRLSVRPLTDFTDPERKHIPVFYRAKSSVNVWIIFLLEIS